MIGMAFQQGKAGIQIPWEMILKIIQGTNYPELIIAAEKRL